MLSCSEIIWRALKLLVVLLLRLLVVMGLDLLYGRHVSGGSLDVFLKI